MLHLFSLDTKDIIQHINSYQLNRCHILHQLTVIEISYLEIVFTYSTLKQNLQNETYRDLNWLIIDNIVLIVIKVTVDLLVEDNC